MSELKKIEGVEIFSTGVWNGNKITPQDLEDMVDAFNKNKEGVRPFLKLGHGNDQAFLQKEGLPAAGWLDNFRVEGNKLIADFIDLPKKIFDLINLGAFRKVSIELFNNVVIKGQKFRKMVGAVALLGAELPGVMDLNDILSLYGFTDYKTVESDEKTEIIKQYFIKDIQGEQVMSKTEKEINLERDLAEAKKEAEALKTANQKFKSDLEANKEKDEEIKKLKEANEKYQADALEADRKAKEAQIEQFATELEKEDLCTPAMKEFVVELCKPEQENYKIKDKEYSRQELLKEALKLFKAADVNLDESSEDGDKQEKTLESAIEKYMKDNEGVEYVDAYKEVAANFKQETK